MSTGRIGVIGLGPMGGAIARRLVETGHEVWVWNRTPEVARRLSGATATGSVAELLRAVNAVVISLPSLRIGRELLDTEECRPALAGKVLVQLSTGRPVHAREQAEWAARQGAELIAGSVLGYPRSLGTDVMKIVYAGSAAAFESCRATLAVLSPGQLFVGEDAGAPASLSGPLWHFYYGAYGSFLEAAAYAEAVGVDVRTFTEAAIGMGDVVIDGMRDSAARIEEGRLSGEQATIAAIHRDLQGAQGAVQHLGIDGLFSGAFIDYLARAIAHGAADLDPAAVFAHVRSE